MKEDVRLLSVIDSASKHARLLYYIYIGFLLYLVITAFSIKDTQLALQSSYISLPIINLSVPLNAFFIVSFLLAVVLYINLMLYQNKLRTLVTDLIRHYDERHISYNKNKLFPWVMNTYGVAERGVYGAVQSVFAGISLWFTLPAALFVLSFIYVKKHDELLSYIIVGAAFASLLLVFLFWNKFNRPVKQNTVWDLGVMFVVVGVIVAGWYATCIMVPDINSGKYQWANLDLRNQVLSKAPKGTSGGEQFYWADFEGANLNGADLRNTVLTQSNLSSAKLSGANLMNADLSNSTLAGAELKGADMRQINLKGADLSGAKLNGADLKNARLEEANLFDAELNVAELVQANLRDTDLERADLTLADLSYANMTRADFHGADLSRAYMVQSNLEDSNLSAAKLDGAVLSGAYMRGAELKGSSLEGTVLSEADMNTTRFENAKMKLADFTGGDLTDATMNGADLEGAMFGGATLTGTLLLGAALKDANFENADLDQAFLYQADLRGTDGLTIEKLCLTGTLWEAKLDQKMLLVIDDISSGCPEKLTRRSFEKWQEVRLVPQGAQEETTL